MNAFNVDTHYDILAYLQELTIFLQISKAKD